MLTKTVDIDKMQTDLKELLSQAAEGAEIVFVQGSTPIARLVSAGRRVAGLHAGAISTSADFDEPLPEKFWVGKA
ncbi:MAG: toxin-antitoxin (TA) system antitoxin [Planctomycetes bacterium]|nr:toxin-antitoxin (TA) system antitoxin [Planctomycetota bacterium]MBM4086090.1 toxin-antitoxin (TA) system antitoxin [Planctomycetota bacterium]